MQGFECDTTRDRARLVAWSLKDTERAWNTPSPQGTLAFARKLVVIGDCDKDGWEDLAAISIDAATQQQMITLHSGARGEILRSLRAEPDERDFAAAVLGLDDRDGDGCADWAFSACVKDPAQPSYCAALILVSGKTGERLNRIISSERMQSTQGFVLYDGGQQAWMLAGRSVLGIDLAAGVVSRSWRAKDGANTLQRLVRGSDGSPCVLESEASGVLRVRALNPGSLAEQSVHDLQGLRPLMDLARVPDRNGDGVEDFLALHIGSAEGLGSWISGKDWSLLGAMRPDGIATQFYSRELHSLGAMGFVITNGNRRPLEKERGAYWFGTDAKLLRVFAGN